MADSQTPKIKVLPFVLADILLLAVAGYIVYSSERPLELWQQVLVFLSVAVGGWCSFIPFTKQFDADTRLAESVHLSTTLAQIRQLESVAETVQQATALWQGAHSHAAQTASAAKEVADKMTLEIKSFAGFLEKANQSERQHLRLEIEKLKKSEGDWIQIVVRILDHVFALYSAALRSGQRPLIDQIGQFQDVCLDAVRRVGLVPFAPRPEDTYDPLNHNLPPNSPPGTPGTPLAATLAPGFTYQGQLLRKPLVALQSSDPQSGPYLSPAQSEPKPSSTSGSPSEDPDNSHSVASPESPPTPLLSDSDTPSGTSSEPPQSKHPEPPERLAESSPTVTEEIPPIPTIPSSLADNTETPLTDLHHERVEIETRGRQTEDRSQPLFETVVSIQSRTTATEKKNLHLDSNLSSNDPVTDDIQKAQRSRQRQPVKQLFVEQELF